MPCSPNESDTTCAPRHPVTTRERGRRSAPIAGEAFGRMEVKTIGAEIKAAGEELSLQGLMNIREKCLEQHWCVG